MSLVNAETGEVVDIADHEEATHLVAEASAAIAHMNVWTGKAIEAVTEAHTRRAWIALGYGSWDEMVEAKNWKWKPLTTGERGAVAEVMRQKGMSFRAIGSVLASSPQTIRRDVDGEFTSDRSGVPFGTPHDYPQQEATDDPGPLDGDAAGYGDGPLGHDEGETTGEDASDTASGGGQEDEATSVPPAATSHPDATPAPENERSISSTTGYGSDGMPQTDTKITIHWEYTTLEPVTGKMVGVMDETWTSTRYFSGATKFTEDLLSQNPFSAQILIKCA